MWTQMKRQAPQSPCPSVPLPSHPGRWWATASYCPAPQAYPCLPLSFSLASPHQEQAGRWPQTRSRQLTGGGEVARAEGSLRRGSWSVPKRLGSRRLLSQAASLF